MTKQKSIGPKKKNKKKTKKHNSKGKQTEKILFSW